MLIILFALWPIRAQATSPLQEARELIKTQYVENVPDWVLSKSTIREMVRYLDQYSSYMTAEEYKEFVRAIDQQYVGIGITIEEDIDGVKILGVLKDGLAEKAGLTAGDVITSIDGRSVKDHSTQYAITLLSGKVGTSVNLTYLDEESQEEKTVEVHRAMIQLPSIEYSMLGGNIGYIRLYSFSENAASEINQAMAKLAGAKGWIVDLRDNGGGYITSAQEVTGLFPSVTKAFQLHYKGQVVENYSSISQKNKFKGRTHLLINNYSASASEMVAAAVKEQKGAVLYGQKTYGKGSMQSLYALSDQSVIKLTTAYIYSPNGKAIQEVGVTPNNRTSIGNELVVSHKDQLKAQYRMYRKLPTLTQEAGARALTLSTSEKMDWTGISSKDVQLIQLGGKEIPINITAVGKQVLKLTPKEKLQAETSYVLLIHSNWKGKDGRNMLLGSWVDIRVK